MKKKKKNERYFSTPSEKDALGEKTEIFKINVESESKKKKMKQNLMKWKKDRLNEVKHTEIKKFKSAKFKKSHKKWGDIRRNDPFPGDAEIPKEKIKKYERGSEMKDTTARTSFAEHRFKEKEKKLQLVAKQAARSELLLHEQAGFLEADEDEETTDVTQHSLKEAVDIHSAEKSFELNLQQFGPYRMNYTRNGRFLILGGGKGHVACIDWLTKKLMCEMNVMETLHDVKWLHQETMFAVAQKQWTYIYDNQGIELHCLKMLDSVLKLEFLPYHFLLASANSKGYLSYIDVSVGQKVAGFSTRSGRLDVMCQNPHNGVICLGHPGGKVTMWSPNVNEPLVRMLCHGGATRSIAVEKTGNYMATSGVDRKIKIWDLRTYKMLESYKVGAGANCLSFSQRDLLAAGIGNVVEVYRDCCRQTVTSPYMNHRLGRSIYGLQFCPYEDVLGASHVDGFASLLIPGAGEANFDGLEANPYQTKGQRRQAEVKMLLEKIQPEMIHLDSGKIGLVDHKTVDEKFQEKHKVLFMKAEKVDFTPRYKKKGRNKPGHVEKRKSAVQEAHKRKTILEIAKLKKKSARDINSSNSDTRPTSTNVLDRFKKKDT